MNWEWEEQKKREKQDLKRSWERERKRGLVWFYGISTIFGNLMPNPFLYINSSISSN